MNYFRVRNFEQFQHYKHRNPPWIRLYYALLHDRRFYRLDDASKFVAIGIFLLASQHDNQIAMDEDWIVKELSLTTTPNWQVLLDSEFIQPIDCDASDLLADCKRFASQSRADSSEQIIQKTDAEILSFSPKTKSLEASRVFKHWNATPGVMHHRSINAHEKTLIHVLKEYGEEEVCLSITRYGLLRVNKDGKYRDVYPWTLSEFVSRENHKNIERLTVEDWEGPFIGRNGNGQKPKTNRLEELQRLADEQEAEERKSRGVSGKADSVLFPISCEPGDEGDLS